jgi:hypothetical protein
MNASTLAKTLAVALAAAMPLSALASPPQPVEITIDCADPGLPSQQAFARFTGIDNFSQAYAARAGFMIRAQRACKRGTGQVRMVLVLPKRAPASVLAQADTSR